MSARRGVVVVGAINVDFVVVADRLPAPGETVVGGDVAQYGGGKGGNAAVAAARAGASVRFVGAVGTEATAEVALRDLVEAGVDVGGVARRDDAATGAALIVVDRHGENQIAVGAGANARVSAEHVGAHLHADAAACVLVSTEIPGAAVAAAVRGAGGALCVLNTAPPIPAVLDVLDAGPLLTPNAGELEALAGMLAAAERSAGRPEAAGGMSAAPAGRSTDPHEVLARRLAARTGAPVVVTLGAEGALVVAPGEAAVHVPSRAAAVRDTTGAGDTFNGVLAAGLAAGQDVVAAVRRAVTAASLSVEHAGARGGMPAAAAIDVALLAG